MIYSLFWVISVRIEVIRPKPFKLIKSRRRSVLDVYKEIVRPIRFLAKKRSPKLTIKK